MNVNTSLTIPSTDCTYYLLYVYSTQDNILCNTLYDIYHLHMPSNDTSFYTLTSSTIKYSLLK
jgi:hypothetical protein